MKTNFKKLALMAGVSAAMAGGSMSAHAVIQAVPAPAVLIPLWVGGLNANTINVRIEVPASVGLDSVVNLFGGPNANASTGIISLSGVATGLSTSAPSSSTAASSQLHWYFMDSTSNEIVDSAFAVSANDVLQFTSAEMPVGASTSTTVSGGAQTGYLVIVNQSAITGLAPTFSFQADAYMVAGSPSGVVTNIPVIPLSDSADNGAGAPTLTNNVVEDISGVAGGAPFGGSPIVSPIVSGIRFAAADASGAPYGWYRVVDFPVINQTGEQYVIWSDRNATTNIVNSTIVTTPTLSGSALTFDCQENQTSSGPLSLTRQLSILTIGTPSVTTTGLTATVDGYSAVSTALGGASNCYALTTPITQSGFVRWIAQGNPYTGGVTGGAYQAGVAFRLRQSNTDATYQFPVDRGFFNGL